MHLKHIAKGINLLIHLFVSISFMWIPLNLRSSFSSSRLIQSREKNTERLKDYSTQDIVGSPEDVLSLSYLKLICLWSVLGDYDTLVLHWWKIQPKKNGGHIADLKRKQKVGEHILWNRVYVLFLIQYTCIMVASSPSCLSFRSNFCITFLM